MCNITCCNFKLCINPVEVEGASEAEVAASKWMGAESEADAAPLKKKQKAGLHV